MSRLFLAIDLPPAVQAQLAALKTALEGARWVPREQLHLTLRFIGDTDEASEKELRAMLALIEVPAFDMAIFGVGQFPKNRPPHVLWAGARPVEPVTHLAAAIEEAVTGAGVAPEQRPFAPHITLARFKRAKQSEVARFLEEHAALESERFRIEEFLLYASVLSDRGATHSIVERFPLGPSA
jgi:2'-5' RNA ligase